MPVDSDLRGLDTRGVRISYSPLVRGVGAFPSLSMEPPVTGDKLHGVVDYLRPLFYLLRGYKGPSSTSRTLSLQGHFLSLRVCSRLSVLETLGPSSSPRSRGHLRSRQPLVEDWKPNGTGPVPHRVRRLVEVVSTVSVLYRPYQPPCLPTCRSLPVQFGLFVSLPTRRKDLVALRYRVLTGRN